MLNSNSVNFNFYQSANEIDCGVVKNNFIVRKKDFELILYDLINDDMQGSVQHFLILGRRGSGKSTLLKRIECEVLNNEFLQKKFVVINFPEEQSGIHRLFDLWEEVIRILKEQSYYNLPDTDTLDIPNDYGEYSRKLFSKIQDAIREKNKKLLLLIDNVDNIFSSFKNDAKILRETLLNFDDVKIIGGSTKMSEHFWRYDMPFYQFFRIIRLEELSKNEIETLLLHWAKVLNEVEIKNFVNNNPGQLETVRILTDGLPRTLQFFINLLINRPQQNGYAYIKMIMDRMTPLYQERLGSLPAIEKKIVTKLAFFWEAVSIKDLVKPTKIESKLLSANLKKLSDIGIVEIIKTGKKNHLYRLSERFFNMWIIVTQGNPVDKRKAKWLTVFLENWYNKQDIKKLISEHLSDLKKGEKNQDHLCMFTKSLAQSKYVSFNERDLLIDETLKLETLNFNLKETLPKKSSEILENIQKFVNKGNYDDALYKANQISNEVDGVKEDTIAYIFSEQGNFIDAEKYYLKAIKKDSKNAVYNLALLYHKQMKLNLAEKYYKEAIKYDDIDAIYNLANLYKIQNRLGLAEKYYIKAIEKEKFDAYNNLAVLYDYQKKYDLAEKFYKKAVEKGNVDAIYNLAVLYEMQEKLKLAEKFYKKAVKQQNNKALHNLILLYYIKASNKKEVQELIKKLIINDDKTKALSIIIRLWLGKTEGIYENVMELSENLDVTDELFILHLLIHSQTNLVWRLFNNTETGQKLKDKYKPLYFAVSLMLNNDESQKKILKIPPEIETTVYNIINTIKELRKHYYK